MCILFTLTYHQKKLSINCSPLYLISYTYITTLLAVLSIRITVHYSTASLLRLLLLVLLHSTTTTDGSTCQTGWLLCCLEMHGDGHDNEKKKKKITNDPVRNMDLYDKNQHNFHENIQHNSVAQNMPMANSFTDFSSCCASAAPADSV